MGKGGVGGGRCNAFIFLQTTFPLQERGGEAERPLTAATNFSNFSHIFPVFSLSRSLDSAFIENSLAPFPLPSLIQPLYRGTLGILEQRIKY